MSSILEKGKEYYNNYSQKDPWENATFSIIKKMENDVRGSFGEKIISEALHQINELSFDMDYTNKSIHEDGHYDIKINGLRIEIKTSCRTVASVWQHEPLYADSSCDIVIFIDFDYDDFYISIVDCNDLPLGHTSCLFPNKKGTLRKNKNDGYKLDFSRKNINNLVDLGLSKKFTAKATIEDITSFVGEKVCELI